MRRVEADLGMRVGVWAGLPFGIVMGIRFVLEQPAVGWAIGLALAGGTAICGMMVGLVSVGCWNWLADQLDPRSVPTDGPAADYHDLPRPPARPPPAP
jgi:hypothetical protein